MRPLDFFDLAADRYRDRVCVVDGERQYTYREVQAMTHRIAGALAANDLQDQDRVAVYSRSDVRALVSALGIMRAGGIFIPINGAAAVDGALAFVRHVKPRWLFHHESLQLAARRIHADVGQPLTLVGFGPGDDEAPSLADWMQSAPTAASRDWADVLGNMDRPITIVQSGGTTGLPKAVVIRTVAYTAYIEAYRRFLAYDDRWPVCLTASQLTPASLSMAVVMSTLGARHVILPGFNASDVLRQIEACGVTHMWLPPTAVSALAWHPDAGRYDLSSLRVVITGGAAVSRQTLRRAVALFGPCVHHSYGQVETGILAWLDARAVAAALAGDGEERLASCGRVNEAMRVEIMGADGRLLPRGGVGEIVARGRGVCEYDNDAAGTAAIRAHGWHHTGDVGHIDASGYLYISGRSRELIVTAGSNVFPREVEDVMLEIAGVRECAVVGVPDDLLGEVVSAVVVREREGAVDSERISAHCRRRVGAVKTPKQILFWPELPKTPAGKVDKRTIVRAFEDSRPKPRYASAD